MNSDEKKKIETIDEYLAIFPEDVGAILQSIRQTIHEVAPDAVEAISYQIPTFKYKGKNLIHFAAFKKHIGLYPTGEGMEAFQDQLSAYKTSKGAIQLPLDQAMPLDLIKQITELRLSQLQAKGKKK